jgi:hypothetical protein
MTQAPNAFAQAAQQVAAAQAPAQAADTNGNLTTAYTGEQSQLFSGPVLPPSLLNKTHGMGTERTGKISEKPYDVQARDFNTKQPKFFLATPAADGKKVGPVAVDPTTGKPNNPVKDTVIVLDTDYRFDAAECAAVGRDANMPDDGKRAFYASGDDLKQLRAEIRRLGLRSEEEMIGLTFTVVRTGQKPNPSGNPSWVTKVTLSR